MFLNDYLFGGMDKKTYWVLPISVGNFGIYCREKKIEEYKSFVESNSK